jgi:hypothetical protein
MFSFLSKITVQIMPQNLKCETINAIYLGLLVLVDLESEEDNCNHLLNVYDDKDSHKKCIKSKSINNHCIEFFLGVLRARSHL